MIDENKLVTIPANCPTGVQRQRKNLMPAFAFRHIKDLYPVFWGKSQQLMQALESYIESISETDGTISPVIDVNDWASRATLDIIGLAGLGQDFNAIADPSNDLNQTYRKILSPNRRARLFGALRFFIPSRVLRALP